MAGTGEGGEFGKHHSALAQGTNSVGELTWHNRYTLGTELIREEYQLLQHISTYVHISDVTYRITCFSITIYRLS